MHLLLKIHIDVSLDRLVDDKTAAWQELLNVPHAYKRDDMISYKGTMCNVVVVFGLSTCDMNIGKMK